MNEASEKWVRAGKYKVLLKRSNETCSVCTGLSSREAQFLELLTTGDNLKRIAQKMEVSPHTADTYKRRVYNKLGVRSAACAIAIAVACYTGATIEYIETEEVSPAT